MCVDSGVREMKSQKRLFAEELVGMFESRAFFASLNDSILHFKSQTTLMLILDHRSPHAPDKGACSAPT